MKTRAFLCYVWVMYVVVEGLVEERTDAKITDSFMDRYSPEGVKEKDENY